jgi:hypothetical protein
MSFGIVRANIGLPTSGIAMPGNAHILQPVWNFVYTAPYRSKKRDFKPNTTIIEYSIPRRHGKHER